MKLQKKHLAAYFPHKVQCHSDGYTGVLDTINSRSTQIKVSCSDWWESADKYKMILKPLSDITNKHLLDIAKICLLDEDDLRLLDWQTTPSKHEVGINKRLPYSVVTYLLQNHFDIFGLIFNDLAVDKNSL